MKHSPRKLQKKRGQIVKKVPRGSKIIKGTLVELALTCGKKNCRCAKGEKHTSFYLSQSHKGKTKMTYIPRAFQQEVQQAVARWQEWRKRIDELSAVNLEILQWAKQEKKNALL